MPEQLPEIMEKLDHIVIGVHILIAMASFAFGYAAGELLDRWRYSNA